MNDEKKGEDITIEVPCMEIIVSIQPPKTGAFLINNRR